jgi:hypothetical protein
METSTQTLLQKGRPFILRRVIVNWPIRRETSVDENPVSQDLAEAIPWIISRLVGVAKIVPAKLHVVLFANWAICRLAHESKDNHEARLEMGRPWPPCGGTQGR